MIQPKRTITVFTFLIVSLSFGASACCCTNSHCRPTSSHVCCCSQQSNISEVPETQGLRHIVLHPTVSFTVNTFTIDPRSCNCRNNPFPDENKIRAEAAVPDFDPLKSTFSPVSIAFSMANASLGGKGYPQATHSPPYILSLSVFPLPLRI
jgi:hypothetical protein